MYGFGQSLFGRSLIAWTPRGINFLGFCQEKGADQALADLREQWSNADFSEDPAGAQRWLDTIFSEGDEKPIPLWLRGSPFQLKVWEALLEIPEGTHATYGKMASLIGHPGAARAVGTAIGNNPVAFIIPCHRVIRQMGELGGYRWGESTKRAIIGYEAVSGGS
jgi:AraC family transcriptional regulator of adaptative response/methylated-DNA-[protein]-cysteine methyltransferase